MNPIHPELLAEKLRAAHDGEPEARAFADRLSKTPRLGEALWFIEWAFRQPGGDEKLLETLLKRFPERFHTRAMMQAGKPQRDGRYSLEQCLAVWKADVSLHAETDPICYLRSPQPSVTDLPTLSFGEFWYWFVHVAPDDVIAKTALQTGVERFNYDFLAEGVHEEATRDFQRCLASWCENISDACGKPRWCPDLLETLCDYMDAHAEEVARSLAATEVTRIVFRELDFARSQNVPVPIVGDSRFGKTTAVSAWCKMRPGLARLVTVPESNRELDFFTAHADALGIAYHTKTPAHGLKRLVEFVHRHSGLFLVYDEAHFLVPVSYHKATPPRRLNWVRCQVIDRDRGCAFFATPQSYRETLDAYVKKTGYCMEQWLGRLTPTVILPQSLDSADVMAVARIHFPEIPEPFLKLISGRAMQREGYLKNMELCVKRALFLAREHGRAEPVIDDVEEAIAWLNPTPAVEDRPEIPTRRRVSAAALQVASRPSAVRMPARFDTEFTRPDSLVRAGELEPAPAG